MTSPTEPRKESLRDRIATRFSSDRGDRLHTDSEERHTRNVTLAFYGVIALIVVVAIAGLAFGFWEANLKPMASVGGTDVSRGQWEDRIALEAFRSERAVDQVEAAVRAGTISADLADSRFAAASAEAPTSEAEVMTDLVDLIFQRQLAEERGIELSEAELDAAVAADGTFPEARRVEALIVLTAEQEQGQAATFAGIADARERAAAAVEELRAGASAEELAETYGPANYESGFVTDGAITDARWNDAIFALEVGGVTDPIEVPTGEQLIGAVTEIAPEQPDEGFVDAVNEAVGEDVHRRNVELEALAAKLEEDVVAEALAREYEQVRLAQILVERNPANLDDSAREVRASHILYEPETPLDEDGNPTAVADLPADDPAWDAAQEEAELAAEELRAIEDVDERQAAFAARAEAESDGPSASRGGDLGYFAGDMMVPEFSAAIFDAEDEPQVGDIIGPIRTDFGWHVILFDGFRPSLDDRLAAVEAALAEEGADFAAVAAEYSDGREAAEGGDIGWQVLDELDDATVLGLSVIDVGEVTEPIDQADGFHIYRKLEEATRQLEGEALAALEATAFADWYDDRYFDAEEAGRISIDDSVYE